jgi:ABC-type Fe3+-hydroxamate transport system substrate-binding protein
LTGPLRLAALVAGLVIELLACRNAGGGSGRVLVVDDAGDTLRLGAPVHRLVSLNPVITELVFALGAGRRLVGRTESCDYPAAAARTPSVGGWLPPNVEAVAGRAPDLVVLYQGPTTAAAAARFRSLGIAVLALRTDHLADVSRVARLLGAVLDVRRAADSLAASYDAALDRLRQGATLRSPRTVALVTWDQPLIVLGAGSFVSEMVELAGARNVFDDVASASVPVSLEALASRAPSIVATLGTTSPLLKRPEWQAVSAIRAHRLLALSDPALSHPTPRAPAAIAALRRQLDSALGVIPPKEVPQ